MMTGCSNISAYKTVRAIFNVLRSVYLHDNMNCTALSKCK